MSLTLRQIQPTEQRLDLRGILPQRLHAMDENEIKCLPMQLGNRKIPLSEVFAVESEGENDDRLTLIPIGNRLDFVGTGLRKGEVIVRGDAGDYAGRAMLGGSVTIEGNAGDFAGSALGGGRLTVDGRAGDRVGAPAAGERHGQHGGFIHIRGDSGARAGERQRRGILFIEGDVGELLGHRMIAGTIYVGGRVGAMAGYGMRRGSLLLRQPTPQLCKTMPYNGRHNLPFLHLLMDELQRLSNGAVANTVKGLEVERYLGDLACDGRGEVLVLD